MRVLPRSFYSRDTSLVARELLGKTLMRHVSQGLLSGRIVETEAYYGLEDPASHSFRGKTRRCAVMWERPGLAYVYFAYGMHFLLNVVTEEIGVAGAVLIRSLEPIEGIDIMRANRRRGKITELASGPAKLTEAFAITCDFNGHDMTGGELVVTAEGGLSDCAIGCSGRIGVSRGSDRQLRFYILDNRFVSKNKPIARHTGS